jgi:Tol biopolymer transport system component
VKYLFTHYFIGLFIKERRKMYVKQSVSFRRCVLALILLFSLLFFTVNPLFPVARLYAKAAGGRTYGVGDLTISGNVGIGGAVLKYGYGFFAVANNNGDYSIQVPTGWTGKVIPTKLDYSFTPSKRDYTNIQSNQVNQNYSTIANTYVYPGNPMDTWRVSIPNGGGQSDNNSYNPSISADGRYVAYWSFASNLVPGDGANDIVVYDNQTGQTSAVSVDSNGIPLDCNSFAPSISADGRYVSFSSCAGGLWVVYVYDRHTGILDSAGRGDVSSISADGRYVAYHSIDNLDFQFRIFVEDMLTGIGRQISISTIGGQPDGDSVLPSMSANGRYVAFNSSATNLINSDTNGVEDVFVYDLQTDEVTRVSVNSSGAQANGDSFSPSISVDGRYIAFHSSASNLTSNDTNGVEDVFVHDLQTGETTRVSINSNGVQGNLTSNQAHVFGNGRYVAFRSLATNLILGDTNGVADIFVYDRQTGQTTRVSVGSNSVQANGDSSSSYSTGFSISEDGKYLAFSSDATNLVNGDTNEYTDIFVHEASNLTSTFADVANIYWARDFIERLYAASITGGCALNPLRYCPDTSVTRSQMAVFLERGIHGSTYNPPAVGDNTDFEDVQPTYWSAAWIKQLAADGITSGCGSGNYCPEFPVTRAQMAIFLLRSKYGASYDPPAVGGNTGFDDVSPSYWAAAWIKQLVAEGITAGCGTGTYCPESPVTRAQMAVFLVRTFNLP